MRYPNFLLLSVTLLLFSACNQNRVAYEQHIPSPGGKWNYALYTDGVGLGDPGYYVLKLDSSINPVKLYLHWNWNTGTRPEEREWMRSREILFNYDEAGFFTSDPHIELQYNRFLIFSRGGYYFSLYDLKTQEAPVTTQSPWHEWRATRGYSNAKMGRQAEEIAYGSWVKTTLDQKVREYIAANK